MRFLSFFFQNKIFTIYILLVSLLALLLVNLALINTVSTYYADKDTLWRLIMHNPNVYLFHIVFFPFIAVFICWGGIRLNNFIQQLHQNKPNTTTRRIRYIYAICLPLVYVVATFVVFFTSDPSESLDLSRLSYDYAKRGATANHFILESFTSSLPGGKIQEDLEKLDEWKDYEPQQRAKFYEKPMKELIPKVINKTHEMLAYRSADELERLLETDVVMLSSQLHKAIPYLQLVFDKDYLDKVQNANPNLSIYDERDIRANALGIGVNTVIIAHFFVFLSAIIIIKRSLYLGKAVPPELMDVVKKFYVAVVMYAFWVALRLLVLQDINLVFGGAYGTIGDVFAGGFLVLTSGIYLTAVMTSVEKLMARIANLWPLIAGFATAVLSYINPVWTSRLFASLADKGQLAIISVAFLLIIALCIVWIMSRPVQQTHENIDF